MPADLQTTSILKLAFGVGLFSVLLSLVLAIFLKFVAQSIFKHRVSYFDAFKAMAAATLTLTVIIVTLIRTGAVAVQAGGGMALQIIGLAFGVVVLAFAIATFVKSPDGIRPDFAQAGVAAAIMQVVSLLIAVALTTLSFPVHGRI